MTGVKGKLKYVAGLFLFLSLEIIVIPVLKLGEYRLSMMDVVRILLNKYGEAKLQQEALNVIREYMQTYMYSIFCWIIFTLLLVILLILIQSRVIYIIGALGQIVDMIFGVGLFFLLGEKLDGMKQVVLFYGMGENVEVILLPVLIWSGLQGIALVLQIVGIVTTADRRKVPKEIIDIEANMNSNPVFEKNAMRKKKMHYSSDMEAERKIYENSRAEEKFEGAILGVKNEYKGKAFQLKALEMVTICCTDGNLWFMREDVEDEMKCADIYYIPQYEEYCVIPQKRRTVFLKSGQPLGANRQYYIPRGEKIKVQYSDGKEKMIFKLA